MEASPSSVLWKETIREFQTLLERQGAFRRVTTWLLRPEVSPSEAAHSESTSLRLELFPNWKAEPKGRPRRPQQLFDPAGRRLVLLVSDCTSEAWHSGEMLDWLEVWGEQAPMTVVQLLPERLWSRSALERGVQVRLRALEPGAVVTTLNVHRQNQLLEQLIALAIAEGQTEEASLQRGQKIVVPVVTLEAEPLKQWAKVVAGCGEAWTTGVEFDRAQFGILGERSRQQVAETPSPEQRVQRFRATASLMAQRLAGSMAAVPVDPTIVNLIRQTLWPQAEPVHVAEVFMGGLMDAQQTEAGLRYYFPPEVQELLLDGVRRSRTEQVLNAVSAYISERLGLSTRSFEALLGFDFSGNTEAEGLVVPFAQVAVQTLARMGDEYAVLAERVRAWQTVAPPLKMEEAGDVFPLLQTFKFREATLSFPAQVLEPQSVDGLEEEFAITAEIQRYGFTAREAEVWRLRRKGLSYDAIAGQLFISRSTVKKHLKNISRKQAVVDEYDGSLESFEFETALISLQPNDPEKVDFSSAFTYLENIGCNQDIDVEITTLKKQILQGTWDGQDYEQIAQISEVDVASLRELAHALWSMLSGVLAAKITQSNFRRVLTRSYLRDRKFAVTITRRPQLSQQLRESLPGGIDLEMVFIPSDFFVMGSPEDEAGRTEDEGPQHEVRLEASFLIGKYPITQAQWQAVAEMPKMEREIDLNPSQFKGANHPVDSISWYDVVEFCDRLSRHTGREYRLPTEAEWEYACRANTTTPFHWGETITTTVANYDGSSYGNGPIGRYREMTRPVDHFELANAFGLHDMHGTLWEWCQDLWHESYKGAPSDGSAWIENQDSNSYVLRGGSWYDDPEDCRSATRLRYAPDNGNEYLGLRVVCALARG